MCVFEYVVFDNFVVKLSGVGMMLVECYLFVDIWDLVCCLIDVFGVDCCMWGSDWIWVIDFFIYWEVVDSFV